MFELTFSKSYNNCNEKRRTCYRGKSTLHDFRCRCTGRCGNPCVRYWEEELDLTIPRNEMGHRYYTRENIQEFQKIKELKEKGYQLKAIRMILHNKNPEDAGVSVRILQHLVHCPHVPGNIITRLSPNRIDRTQIKPTCL